MKKVISITIVILFLVPKTFTQIIGGNGEGLTSVYSTSDAYAIKELTEQHPIAIRWPGGGDSRVAFPALDKPGLGMNKDSITKLYDTYRDAKGNVKLDQLERELQGAEKDALKPKSDLQNLIELSRIVPNLQVDFCLNVLMGTVESNISVIQTLLDSGVNIISIVAGNETFFSYRFDWEKYRIAFEPILNECAIKFPQIPRIVCIAQELERKDHIKWNTNLIAYINKTGNFIAGVDVHYYMLNEIKSANAMHPKSIVYKKDGYYPELEKAFDLYISSYRANNNFEALIKYMQLNLPGKIYHCTEFGDKEADYWSNTIANAAHTFSNFCTYRNSFDILLVQNFMANWLWSSRRVAGKYDDNPNNVEKINRCHWYSIQLANELPYDALALKSPIKITNKGIYYYYFDNAGGKKYVPEISIKNGELTVYELHYLTGKYNYSSAGSTGFMAKGSDNTLEIKGIDVLKTDKITEIPYNSFGYVRIVVE